MPTGRVLPRLQALAKLPRPGPTPIFTHIHVTRALLIIGDEGRIGRIELSRELGLGEGAIRTIIKHLTQAKIIVTDRGGCALTNRGRLLYMPLRSKMSKPILMDARQLALDKFSATVMIRASSRLVKMGIEQRDAAIRAGATGACTLVCRRGAFVMPMSEGEESKLSPKDPLFQELQKLFNSKENDAISIVSAAEKSVAEDGAIAAALTLIE